ncbi:ATP12-domain-containing protein [Agrocybe pediades]|nr:ATP12-domain-containing protein [Agrocybe pediades]
MFLERLARHGSARLATRNFPKSRITVTYSNARWQSTTSKPNDAAHDGPPVTDTNRAETTQKRFWKDVDVEQRDNSWVVTLDRRALKTPSGNALKLPLSKSLPATLIAAEWDHQETLLKPHALPMTSITARAVDAMTDEKTRADVIEAIVKYIHTDTICFFHDNPEPLERLQAQRWTPLLDWARKAFDITLNVSNSVLSVRQPAETEEKLRKVLQSFDNWELAAVERATYSSKSLVIALALVKKHLSVEDASLASTVEVDSQIERWGEVEDTHDVDYQDIRRQLGSAACLLSNV